MRNLFYAILLFITWIIIGIFLSVHLKINFGFDKMLWNWVTSWFNNSIKAPLNITKEVWNIMWF